MTSSSGARARAVGAAMAIFLVAPAAQAQSSAPAVPLQPSAPVAPAQSPPGASTAQASGPSAGDLETARTLFKEGRERRAAGDLQGALEALKAAHALGQTPITGLELARTYEAVGDLLEARELCLAIGRMPVASDETERSAAARRDATAFAEALRPRIAAVHVRIEGAADGERVELTLDGAPLPAAALGLPRKVNPGAHVIVARTDRRPAVQGRLQVAEGETREVLVQLPPATNPATGPAAVAGSTQPAHRAVVPWDPVREGAAQRRTSPFVTLGVVLGAGGTAVGVATGIATLNKAEDLRSVCPDRRCPPAQHEALDSSYTTGMIANVAFGVAAVGVGALIYGLLSSRSSASRGVALVIAPRAVGLGGSF